MRARGLVALVLAIAGQLVLGCGGEAGDLHVTLDRLPACGYGLAPERPFVAEVWDERDARRVAETSHGGIDMGEETLRVELYAAGVRRARYRVRLGMCPSLLERPMEALRCEDPAWVWEGRRTMRPRGVGRAHVFRLPELNVACQPRLEVHVPGGGRGSTTAE